MENSAKLTEVLNKQLGLTPYESQAYVALLTYGPMSPSELAKKATVPRPRTYDVLKSLMERGLLKEQSGKPPVYAAVEPSQGLQDLLVMIEMETLRQLEEKRKTIQSLTKSLSQMYKQSKSLKSERSKVWFTQRDSAFVAIYCEAIRNCEREFVVATTSTTPPETEVLDAVEFAIKKGTSVKVVREIAESWDLKELKRYEKVVKAGSQVRYLSVKEIPFRYVVFDRRDIILVFPPESRLKATQTTEALWLRIPPLANILHDDFEALWKKAEPVLPILSEMIKRKQASFAR
jgi:sugar-specific transcriptional regulator TrmB